MNASEGFRECILIDKSIDIYLGKYIYSKDRRLFLDTRMNTYTQTFKTPSNYPGLHLSLTSTTSCGVTDSKSAPGYEWTSFQ